MLGDGPDTLRPDLPVVRVTKRYPETHTYSEPATNVVCGGTSERAQENTDPGPRSHAKSLPLGHLEKSSPNGLRLSGERAARVRCSRVLGGGGFSGTTGGNVTLATAPLRTEKLSPGPSHRAPPAHDVRPELGRSERRTTAAEVPFRHLNASKLRLEPVRRGGPIFPLRTDRERGVTS
jgi:hypothetical protein